MGASTEYPKINGLWKRDQKGKILPGEWSLPEFELLKDIKWHWTEKIDGTNIRLTWPGSDDLLWGNEHLFIQGRTDKAQIPPKLLAALIDLLRTTTEFSSVFDGLVTLYGEGFGAGIQKGGGNYRPDNGFILFDVRIGDFWLSLDDVEDVAAKLGLDVVPRTEPMTLLEAELLVARGTGDSFFSQWAGVTPEGLVGRTQPELQTRRGQRILTKIKIKDYE